ncbi:MAG: hypothetical protein GF393_00405 [Armatimonadia bacterium]|nr:hypothetical protein [Armatimonadia bacterium]
MAKRQPREVIRGENSEKEEVGGFEMRTCVATPSPASAGRWEERAEALAKWLLTEWQREQRKEAA